ncbi:MAG: NAD(P)/FAD-dependent oxidoreductase [Verrucomicrobia bacterium]|nr:NAD(P)/FAD-dependent oxidoreductase [Verrucomicrobiota bacterium]
MKEKLEGEGQTDRTDVAIIGGGAAGFFAAIACAAANPELKVAVYEKSSAFLSKVRISGGGRCNVTHRPLETRDFAARYPRGERSLLSLLHRFAPRDTLEWFEARGVRLKTEADGRVFPTTDSSQTIIDCLVDSARGAGVSLHAHHEARALERIQGGGFRVRFVSGKETVTRKLLLATGGVRSTSAAALAESSGHSLNDCVPSLFTLHLQESWLKQIAGTSVADAIISVPGMSLKERGPILATHWGLSGPAVLRLSAWGARKLHAVNYCFPACIQWLPNTSPEALEAAWKDRRERMGARTVMNCPLSPLPARLWEQLAIQAGFGRDDRWSKAPRGLLSRLTEQVLNSRITVMGKSLNKEEFVTCGGIQLDQINLRRMESRLVPGLHFAGELIDIDGITGGFNFQAAWTTGWIAGQSMAEEAHP